MPAPHAFYSKMLAERTASRNVLVLFFILLCHFAADCVRRLPVMGSQGALRVVVPLPRPSPASEVLKELRLQNIPPRAPLARDQRSDFCLFGVWGLVFGV